MKNNLSRKIIDFKSHNNTKTTFSKNRNRAKSSEKKKISKSFIKQKKEKEQLNNSLDNSLFQIRAFFKVILLGDLGVGKTTLSSQFLKKFLKEKSLCQINMDFNSKELIIDNKIVELQIWDTCGQEEYSALTKQFYRDCNGCLMIFDLSNHKSFENLQRWKEELTNRYSNKLPVVIVGNKKDKEAKDINLSEKAKKMAKDNNYEYIETSAIQMVNVKKVFKLIARMMLEYHKNKHREDDSFNESDQRKRRQTKKSEITMVDSFFDEENNKSKCC